MPGHRPRRRTGEGTQRGKRPANPHALHVTRLAGSRRSSAASSEQLLVDVLQRPARFIGGHAALLLGVATGLLVPVKILRVVHGDPTQALALLAASDKAQVLTGVAVLVLPSVVGLLCLVAAVTAAGAIGDLRSVAQRRPATREAFDVLGRLVSASAALAVLILLLTVTATPGFLVAVVLTGTVMGLVNIRLHTHPQGEPELPTWLAKTPLRVPLVLAAATALMAAVAVGLALAGPLNDRVWLAPHSANTEVGASTVYVLSVEGPVTTVLDDRTRAVYSSHADQLALCRPTDVPGGLSAWDALLRRPSSQLPLCPDSR